MSDRFLGSGVSAAKALKCNDKRIMQGDCWAQLGLFLQELGRGPDGHAGDRSQHESSLSKVPQFRR